jgi:hypothetical protein
VVSRHRQKWGYDVPGGFVTTELRGGFALVGSILRQALGPSTVQLDIVVYDATRKHELYREGPFSDVSVNRSLNEILDEIGNLGFDEFLRRRQIANSQIGPVSAPSGRRPSAVRLYYRAATDKLTRRSGGKT